MGSALKLIHNNKESWEAFFYFIFCKLLMMIIARFQCRCLTVVFRFLNLLLQMNISLFKTKLKWFDQGKANFLEYRANQMENKP